MFNLSRFFFPSKCIFYVENLLNRHGHENAFKLLKNLLISSFNMIQIIYKQIRKQLEAKWAEPAH